MCTQIKRIFFFHHYFSRFVIPNQFVRYNYQGIRIDHARCRHSRGTTDTHNLHIYIYPAKREWPVTGLFFNFFFPVYYFFFFFFILLIYSDGDLAVMVFIRLDHYEWNRKSVRTIRKNSQRFHSHWFCPLFTFFSCALLINYRINRYCSKL